MSFSRSGRPLLALALAAACSTAQERAPLPRGEARGSSGEPAAPAAAPLRASASAGVAGRPEPPAVALARATEVLFSQGAPATCTSGDDRARVRCMVAARFAEHDAERTLALGLFDDLGDVVGVEREHRMEGGFRGTIHIVPELPVARYQKHLAWVAGAQREIQAFVREVKAHAGGREVRYRHEALAWRFFRSVGRTTPSAYAGGWEIGYNVSGSLHGSATAVRDTIFHEVFHLNDQDHGGWSRRALGELVDGIVAKCGTKTACLAPYAPSKTMVRGGTYYAFQPDNGDYANEYAAELATRYFLEQRAAMRGEPLPEPSFKCGPEENARAWKALADEFFAGVDRVAPCG